MAINVPVTPAGAQPTPPLTLWANLITAVAADVPGYTVLPGGLIQDLAGTATYALALIDSAAVETINSLTPFGANPYIINELGVIYGVKRGVTTNTSVQVVFSGVVGTQIPVGFLVSDGSYQYQVQDGGAVGSGGSSNPIYCVATVPGSFPVPPNTVTGVVSSVPPGSSLIWTNPLAGTPSAGDQTLEDYTAQVLQAGLVSGLGSPSTVKALLSQVPGVQPRLVACRQINGGGWEVICGGGDPYAVAAAIFDSGLDISTLSPSIIGITGITNASPGVVTTNLDHGLITGQTNVHIAGVVGMSGVNGGPYTVTVLTPRTFSFAVNTTGSGSYVSGGVVTPNNRNAVVNLIDYPDTYTILYVIPPQQTVTVQCTWNTDSPNVVSPSAVAQMVIPAVVAYINGVYVGRPINEFELNAVFQAAVTPILAPDYVSRIIWTISINGVATAVLSGTGLVVGDPESYFSCLAAGVTVTQG